MKKHKFENKNENEDKSHCSETPLQICEYQIKQFDKADKLVRLKLAVQIEDAYEYEKAVYTYFKDKRL